MGFFLRHLELALCTVGLLLIFVLALVLPHWIVQPNLWLVVAATILGIIQAISLWAVRARQQQERDQTISEVQRMLQDVINNQLVVIQMADQINRRKPGTVPSSAVERSVGVIHSAVSSLSHDSLHAWTTKYKKARRRNGIESWLSELDHLPPRKLKLDAIVPEDMLVSAPAPDLTGATPPLDSSPAPPSSPISSQPIPHSDMRQLKRDDEEPNDEGFRCETAQKGK